MGWMHRGALLLLATACAPVIEEPPEPPLPGSLAVAPDLAGQGRQVRFTVTAAEPDVLSVDRTPDFGEGLQVVDWQVEDATTGTALVQVDADAALGPRDVAVDGALPRRDALTVIAESYALKPAQGRTGEILRVDLSGRATAWDDDTSLDLGDGITVLSVEVDGLASATAEVAIAPDAVPGPRDVQVDGLPAFGAFTVVDSGIDLVLEPREVPQGTIVDFGLDGVGTAWTDDTRLVFHDAGGPTRDVLLPEQTVLAGTAISGRLQASNAAPPGPRDLEIITDDRRLWLPDAIQVTPTEAPLDDVLLHVSWTHDRTTDHRGWTEVEASLGAVFWIPLDPPCGSPPPPNGDIAGFDRVHVQVDPPTYNRGMACPRPKTVDAGPSLTLVAPNSAILLERTRDKADRVVYRAAPAVADRVPVDTTFDLVVDGGGRIPAVTVSDILRTPAGEARLLDPPGRSHDRDDPLDVTWSPALTYPNALLRLDLEGRSQTDDRPARLAVLPWDDGAITLDPKDLRALASGSGRLRLRIETEGEPFTLPFSEMRQREATVELTHEQAIILE